MGELLESYDSTVKANRQIVTSLDDALVAAGRKIAERVDEATATGDGQEVTKALYLLPHLMNVLREMHATPASRLAAGISVEETKVGKLAKLRSVAGTAG